MQIIREIGSKGQVVIPKDVRKHLGLSEGSKVVFEVHKNEVNIKPVKGADEFVEDFFNIPAPKRKLTWKQVEKELEEKYEIR